MSECVCLLVRATKSISWAWLCGIILYICLILSGSKSHCPLHDIASWSSQGAVRGNSIWLIVDNMSVGANHPFCPGKKNILSSNTCVTCLLYIIQYRCPHIELLSAILVHAVGNPPAIGGFTSQKASNMELRCFQAIKQTTEEMSVVLEAMMLTWLPRDDSTYFTQVQYIFSTTVGVSDASKYSPASFGVCVGIWNTKQKIMVIAQGFYWLWPGQPTTGCNGTGNKCLYIE